MHTTEQQEGTMQDYMQQHLGRWHAPINTAKKHNYLLVEVDCELHYLDRYVAAPTTLCGTPAGTDRLELELDAMGYHSGVDCTDCRDALTARVQA
jgi:hypothetical protein